MPLRKEVDWRPAVCPRRQILHSCRWADRAVRGREPVVLWFDAETTALWQESAMKNISEILASVEETPVTFEDYLKAYADPVGELINSYIPHGTHGDMDRYLYDPLYHYSENAGKRHRPLICFAACLAVGGDPDRAATAAAAIEHFHSAALIHDDIADEAELRRGEPCLHLTEGLGLAINMGDLALSMVNGPVVNDPLLEDAVKVRVIKELIAMTCRTVEGQALDLGWARDGRYDITPEDYLTMAIHKTAHYSGAVPWPWAPLWAAPTTRSWKPCAATVWTRASPSKFRTIC